MESVMLVSPRPLVRARSALPRIAPSTITSIVIEDLRPKNTACSGIGETSASMIIAQWAAWRRQAFEKMLLSAALDLDRDSLASIQAVSTMLHASFLRARAAADDDGGSGRRAVVLQSSPGSSVGEEWHVRKASQGKGDAHVKQRDTREPPRLCGWQVGRLVVARELQALSERRAVSAFVHRECIESFLRGRFYFHGGWPMHDDERSAVSMATISTGDQYVNVENTSPNSDDEYRHIIDQPQMYRYENVYSDSAEFSEHASSAGSFSANLSEARTDYGQPNEGEGGAFLHGDNITDSQKSSEPRLQLDQSFDSPSYNNWLDQPVDGFYGVELPELLSRRSVYNLLSDGFGERLGQVLIQSYAQRQEHVESHILNAAASVTEDYVNNDINEPNDAQYDRPWIVSSGQGPRRRQWYWTRPEFVLDAIKDLETDMAGLYHGMTSVQHMMGECMEMQMEVQRSIRQEVTAAMNRSIGIQGSNEGQLDDPSRGHLVRKGTCCVCSDNQIDSLLYRCGHMCTCSKCARELINEDGKCPMCRAPIVDVVRAYTT